MNVSVLVPYRTDHDYREKSWKWVSERWKKHFPEFEIILGDVPGPFSRTSAINDAAKKAQGEIFIIADCDTTFDSPFWLSQSIDNLDTWALARTYEKLSSNFTSSLLTYETSLDKPRETEYNTDFSWSGIVVVKKEDFLSVGGFDERFTKWGEEDICFGLLMNEVSGIVTRCPGYVCHLWHPQSNAETFGHSEWPRQRELSDKYREAVGNKELMLRVRFGG